METIVRNIGELGEKGRTAAEQLVGHELSLDQQLVIVVQSNPKSAGAKKPSASVLPDWCNVYAGLSDSDIAEIEAVMLRRADLSRSGE